MLCPKVGLTGDHGTEMVLHGPCCMTVHNAFLSSHAFARRGAETFQQTNCIAQTSMSLPGATLVWAAYHSSEESVSEEEELPVWRQAGRPLAGAC